MNTDINQLMVLSEQIALSRFFKESQTQAQALVKVLAGQELGIPPIAAQRALYIHGGQIMLTATGMASLVRRSKHYDFNLKTSTNVLCEIEAIRIIDSKREVIGVSRYSIEEAKQAGLLSKDNWRNYPLDMLYARAMSRMVKHFMPDLTMFPIYNPDEFDIKLNADGEPIYAEFTEMPPTETPENPPQITHIRKISEGARRKLEAEIRDIAKRTETDSQTVRDRVKAWIKTVFQVEHFAELNISQFNRLYERLPKFEQTITAEKQNQTETEGA